MWFLVGVIVLIVFVLGTAIYIKVKIRKTLDEAGYVGQSLADIYRQAKIRQQMEPKSLTSMDSIYLEQVKEDFPSININELKRQSEQVILDCFNAVEKKNSRGLKGKIRSFVDDMINDYEGKTVKFDDFKIHKTVLAKYKKEKGTATLYFASSFEYVLNVDGKCEKTQDRARTEFIYIIDEAEIGSHQNAIDFHCPNCNSPITNLGQKKCSYCGTAVVEVVGRIFGCDNIVRY
jgi:hypothetical protein